MKKVFLLTLAAVFIYSSAAIANEGKYAFVDIAKVFDEYQKTKDNDKILQEAGKKKEQERDTLVHEVRQIKDEMVLLNDDARAKKQEVLEGKVKELQTFDQNAKKQLGEQRNTVVREIFKDIDDTVKRYGERKGLDFIFNERALIFQSNKYDITSEILADLNKGYSNKK